MPEIGVQLCDVPLPKSPSEGEVLIAVSAAGICGSDLHVYEWTKSYEWMRSKLPLTLGHEFVGIVMDLGPNTHGVKIGDRVVVRPSITCGICKACLDRRPDDCRARDSIGMLRDGGFAKQVLVPVKNCLHIPDQLPDEIAALTEPFTIAAQAINIAQLKPLQKVIVFGPGTIGQGIAILAKNAGCSVVVVGKDDAFRLKSTREIGIEETLDFDDPNFDKELHKHIEDGLFDVVFEASGAAQVLDKVMSILRPNGSLVVAGIYANLVPVDLTSIVRNQFQIKGSFRPLESAWPTMIEFLACHHKKLKSMVSHVIPLDQSVEGFQMAMNKNATKVVIKPE